MCFATAVTQTSQSITSNIVATQYKCEKNIPREGYKPVFKQKVLRHLHCYKNQTGCCKNTTGGENLKVVNFHAVHSLSRCSERRIRRSRFRISARRHATMTGISRPLPSTIFQSIIPNNNTTHTTLQSMPLKKGR